jgi:N6-adenosine-specific RNA methylase IME4
MRGVRCSWVDLEHVRWELSADRRGDQEALARLRCVGANTVGNWRAALSVVDAIKGKVQISALSHVQPSHAEVIARAFRKRHGKEWSEEVKEEIADLVHRCEAERLTVEKLRAVLVPVAPPSAPSDDSELVVRDLQQLIAAGKTFGTIYADPPWRYGNTATRAAAEDHYPTMAVEEIAALPVAALAAPQCHLHLWTTTAFLFEAKQILDVWNFTYKGVFVWCKPQMGLGNYWRCATEFLLLGVRGELTFADRGLKNFVEARRGAHSAKPEEVRRLVERASPGPRLELFARKATPGWTAWGNQVEASPCSLRAVA